MHVGMFASVDCMHWNWKNCPSAWAGQYQGKEKVTTVVLEAVAGHDLHFWHAFFGSPGSLNDLNILAKSPLIDFFASKNLPQVKFQLNGETEERTQFYLLGDGIYPNWSIFVKSMIAPSSVKEKYFSQRQESVRKDVERAFGVVQARFEILTRPSKLWFQPDLHSVMYCCIILHNMILKDENCYSEVLQASRTTSSGDQEDVEDNEEEEEENDEVNVDEILSCNNSEDSFLYLVQRLAAIENSTEYFKLREALIIHLWSCRGEKVL